MLKSIVFFFGLILWPVFSIGQQAKIVYQSHELIITQISSHSYMHTSFLNTQDFGRVDCNGMVAVYKGEAVVFDTPVNDTSAEELLHWLRDSLHIKPKAVVATHFHDDCLGGITPFYQNKIPLYASCTTFKLANLQSDTTHICFDNELLLLLSDQSLVLKFWGAGHTQDNIVGYFSYDQVLFGGCLVKSLGAGKGFLGDANTQAWPVTIDRVKKAYPHVKWVVPGHGKYGDSQLLDYTYRLFKQE